MLNLLDRGCLSAFGDGQSHPLGADAGMFSAVGATATDERDWAALQLAADTLSAQGGGRINLPAPNTYVLSRPLRARSFVEFAGEGRGTKLQARSGESIVCAVMPSGCEDTSVGGPVADGEGFVLGSPGRHVVELSDTLAFARPPADGTHKITLSYQWVVGAGPVVGFGGNLLSTDVGFWYVLMQDADGRLRVYNHDFNGGSPGVIITPNVVHQVKVLLNPDGSGHLKIDDEQFPLSGVPTYAPRWFDRLVVGGLPDGWPGGLRDFGSTLHARVKNFFLDGLYGGLTVPFDDGNRYYFRTSSGGWVLARPTVDLPGVSNVGLRDLWIDCNPSGVGVYANNSQHMTLSRLTVVGTVAMELHKNVYSSEVSHCHLYGAHTAFRGIQNAPFATPLIGHEFHGLKCCLALNNTDGAHVVGGWAHGPTSGVNVVVNGGDGCRFGATGFRVIDDGIGPPGADALMVLRNVRQPDLIGSSPVRSHSPGHALVVDGGDSPE